MSEEIGNTPGTGTSDESTELQSSENNANKDFDFSTKAITDNIGKALNQANAEAEGIPQAVNKAANTETISLDDIANVELPDGDHKGINYNQVIQGLPEDAQKILANIRKSYTKKTQELASQRKDLQSQMQAFHQNQQHMDNLQEVASRETTLDPYDTESFNKRIEEEVAKRMQDMIKPMQEEYHLQQRKAKLDDWTSKHPDYVEYKSDIVTLLKGNQNLDLQNAYYIVKGKAKTEKAKALEAENKRYKDAARSYGLKVSAGNTITGNKPPKGLSSYDLYKWVQAQKEGKK